MSRAQRTWSWSDVLREAKRWANYDDGAEYDTDDDGEPVARETVLEKFSKATGDDTVDPEDMVALGIDTGEIVKVDGGLIPADERDAADTKDAEDEPGGSNPRRDATETDEDGDFLTWRDVFEEVGRDFGTTDAVGQDTFGALVEVLTGDETDGYEAVARAVEEGILEKTDGGLVPPDDAAGTEPVGAQQSARTALEDARAVEDSRFYPDEIQARDIWVSWALDDEGRKRPRAPWLTGHCYPAKWKGDLPEEYERPETNFEEAHRYTRQKGVDLENAGYHFPETDPEKELKTGIILPVDRPPRSRRITLIDWDDVRDPETGEVHPICAEYLRRFDCYAEISQSGKGIHQFVIGGLKDRGKLVEGIDLEPFVSDEYFDEDGGLTDKIPGVEIYDGGRHVAMTGRHVEGTGEDLVEGQEFIDEICERFGGGLDEDHPRGEREPETVDVDLTEIDEPDELPECARRLLEARVEDNAGYSTGHELNLHAALLVMYSGFDLDDAAGYFEKYPPNGSEAEYDAGHTEKALRGTLEKIEKGNVAPVGLSTLRENGVFGDGETCDPDCPIHGSDGILRRYSADERDDEHEAVLPEVENHAVETEGFVDNRDGILTEARDRTEEKVVEAITSDDRVVLEAIPTLGKSRGAVKAAAETDEQVAILTSRHELYDQVEKWAEEFGASVQRLPTFFEECPTASGAHGSEWKERVKSLYNAGATGADIHAYADPPCQEDGTCPYSRAWDRVDEENTDVLVGNYLHAHVPKARKGRTLIFDEFPEDTFTETLAGEKFKKAVTAYVETVDALPFDDYTEILERRDEEVVQETVAEYFERSETDLRDTERAVHDEDFHAYAPAVVYGLVTSEDFGNGFEYAEIDTEGVAFVSYNRTAGVVHVHAPPKIGNYTQGVVALDGTPTVEMWETALKTRMNHTQVLTDDERREYLKDGLNVSVVQTTEYVKPYSSGENVSVAKDEALLDAVARKHDRDVDLITTMSARHAYPGEETSVEFDGVGEVKHFGNLKGSNDFKKSRLGAVVGSRHYGDGFIKKWAAFMGERAERGEEKGTELSYGETGDKIHRHMTEHEVAQALLRFGRDGNGAVVYVATSKIPDWVPREATVEDTDAKDVVRRTRSEAERQVMRRITDEGRQTTAELSEVVDVSRRQVRNITEKLGEEGLVARESIGNGYEFTPTDDAVDAAELGDVGLDKLEVSPVDPSEGRSEETRSIVHTWNFRPVESFRRSSSRGGGGGGVEVVEAGPNGGGRPPDDT